jgi:hypothetical protein
MLLQRILDTPQLARAVARLQPELLHRVIRHVGLEDAAELVALATPEQLSRVFDLDLWQASHPGVDEQFDAARFGTWLQVLLDAGPEVAADKLAAIAPDMVIAGLARHARVVDLSSVTAFVTLDGELSGGRDEGDARTCEIGGYRLSARRDDAWDANVEVLLTLETAHPQAFDHLMTGCRALSSSRPEESGMHDLLDDPEQAMFDLAFERERRRERQGYVAPEQARAFLDMARRSAGDRTGSASNPMARAYFQALADLDGEHADESGGAGETDASETDASPADVAAVVDVLMESGVLDPPPRALLTGTMAATTRLAHIHEALRVVVERDAGAYARRSGELGYLANTLVAGCALQGRPFTPQEATDAVLAVCNLGLENWPVTHADDVLVAEDLVGIFQVGWRTLHEKVGMPAARRLVEVLSRLRPRDRDLQIGLHQLRVDLERYVDAGTPWHARRRLEMIASLDLLAWAGLVGLIDECPVIHAAVRAASGPKPLSVRPADFDFVSGNADVACAEAFLAALPETLGG